MFCKIGNSRLQSDPNDVSSDSVSSPPRDGIVSMGSTAVSVDKNKLFQKYEETSEKETNRCAYANINCLN